MIPNLGRYSREGAAIAKCDRCGNDYDEAFQVNLRNETYTFDSFECAIQKLAPACPHCDVRIIGHGVEQGDIIYCCAYCAEQGGRRSYRSRALRPSSVSDLFRRPVRKPFVIWVRSRRLSCISRRMLAIVRLGGRHLVVGTADRLLFRDDRFGGGRNFLGHSQFLTLHRQELAGHTEGSEPQKRCLVRNRSRQAEQAGLVAGGINGERLRISCPPLRAARDAGKQDLA